MDFLIYPIHLITAHPIVYMVAVILLPVVIAIFCTRYKRTATNFQKGLCVALLIFLPVNIIFGGYINSKLLFLAGEPGVAEVVGTYNTISGNRYSNHIAVGYRVLLKTLEGATIQTSFRDDDFNVYPWDKSVVYPHVGGHCNVRYLKHFPESFIIVTNDDSL